MITQIYGSNVCLVGGHELFVRELSRLLAKRGFSILIIHSGRDVFEQDVVLAGVRSVCFMHRFCIPVELAKFVRLVKLGDVVHIHCPSNPFALVGAFVARVVGKRVVATVLCYLGDLFHYRWVVRFVSPFLVLFDTLGVLLADVVHVENVRDFMLLRWVRRLGKRLVYAEPIVDRSVCTSRICLPRSEARTSGVKVLYLGRVDRAKGVHVAVEALRYLPSGSRLVIAGPIQDVRYFRKLLELRDKLGLRNRVYIVGRVDEAVKERLLEWCDVVVVPSLSDIVEAYSRVVTEAWARCKPVVVSPVGALRYRVHNSIDGIVARKAGDAKALAEAILQACNIEMFSVRPCLVPAYPTLKMVYEVLAGSRAPQQGVYD